MGRFTNRGKYINARWYNFLATAMGATVHAEGRLIRKGRSMFFCDCRVVDAATGKNYAAAQGVYKYF